MGVPLKVGLTGGIASGKSTVANLFSELGVVTVDADVIARQIVEPGQPALTHIREVFGPMVISQDGQLKRAVLRRQIFADPEQRRKLEAILHPRIRAVMEAKVFRLRVPYCLLCVPLLVEAHQLDLVERVLVVDCSVELQRERLRVRDRFVEMEINQVIGAQMDREARLAIANDVIYNSSGLDWLREQVLALHLKYSAKTFS